MMKSKGNHDQIMLFVGPRKPIMYNLNLGIELWASLSTKTVTFDSVY